MGAARLRAKTSPSDYFLSTLFSREQALPVELEFVVAHEVGHAIANTLLNYPIEFTSVTSTIDGKIGGFTKNTDAAKVAAEAAMRRNDRQRALQLAAIDFAGPLAEYWARIRRSVETAAISLASRNDKQSAFRLFCYANAIVGKAGYRFDTGDVDLSSNDLRHLQPAWAQWKLDSYALAKATLHLPSAVACARSIEATIIARLRRGGEVRVDGSEINSVLSATPLGSNAPAAV
jgi:hypothetical protein